MNVAKPAQGFVQQILGVPVAIDATRHPNVVPVDAKLFGAIGESQRDLGEANGLARLAAVENHIRHLIAAQRFGGLLAEYPAYGIEHIGFSATVRPDDCRDAFVEIKKGFVGERFKAEQLERL